MASTTTAPAGPPDDLSREWLVTNGLGGYASATVSGVLTRSYHGLLIAALPAPVGRAVLLGPLGDEVVLPAATGRRLRLEGEEPTGGRLWSEEPGGTFALEDGLPVWRWVVEGAAVVVEKRVWMPHRANAVLVRWEVSHLTPQPPLPQGERGSQGRPLKDDATSSSDPPSPPSPLVGEGGWGGEGIPPYSLHLRPGVFFRPLGVGLSHDLPEPLSSSWDADRLEVRCADPTMPPLRLRVVGADAEFVPDDAGPQELRFRIEAARGYASTGQVYRVGRLRVPLAPGRPVTLVVTCGVEEPVPSPDSLDQERRRRRRLIAQAVPEARAGLGADLVLAADQFVIAPPGRGREVESVIAGYHWFTDWGRDTMISLEGLALLTGRHLEAGAILRMFAAHVRDGLIPNFFPDGQNEGVYHTADATLWFFHALDRYLHATGDRDTLRRLLPTLRDIVHRHQRGTRFGIQVDPGDGLLRQGEPGYQLTWMDARVGDWVVTPRRGKAVEINALWFNALCLLRGWVEEEVGGDGAAGELRWEIERVRRSFNERFWSPHHGHLFDVVDGEQGDDPSCRPNQLLAVSLPHPVLDRGRWAGVLAAAREKLLTPVGLRSLSPDHPDYQPRYDGDLRSRDAAYHQGTVWPWLIGPYVGALLKAHPERRGEARRLVEGFVGQLGLAGAGTLSEIHDATEPYTPRGCVAQAWSVAEVLRAWVLTAGAP